MQQSASQHIGSYHDYKDARARQAKFPPRVTGEKEVFINGKLHRVTLCSPGIPYGAYLGQCGTVYNAAEEE